MISIEKIKNYLDTTHISYTYSGDEHLQIRDYKSIENIKPHSISWIKDESRIKSIVSKEIKSSLFVSKEIDTSFFNEANFIFCNDPKQVFFSILNHFFNREVMKAYISSNSVVETTSVGGDVYIGHNCYIGPNVEISNNVKIYNNVSIEGKVKIGKNTIIHSGVNIGTDGFGYFKNTEGKYTKVPHFGGVTIGEDVEIGANTCIDKGTMDDTRIGDFVKIGNLCQIAHNVIIEENVMVASLSNIAGSIHLKKHSYIAPSVTIMNQVSIGENSLIGLGAVVLKDVEDNVVVAGVPGKTIRKLEGHK